MAAIRRAGFPNRVAETLLASLKSSTVKRYANRWKDWRSWVQRQGLAPFPLHHPDRQLAECLVHYAESRQLSWRALIQLRLAVRWVLRLLGYWPQDGAPDASLQVLRGLRNLSELATSPRPRYAAFWDVNALLEVLRREALPASDVPCLVKAKRIRDMAIIRVALALLARVSDLQRLVFTPVSLSDSSVAVRVCHPKQAASQRPVGQLPVVAVQLVASPEEALCPVRALARWTQVRPTGEGVAAQMFVTLSGAGFHPLAVGTLSRILLRYMAEAHVDVRVFHAHSLRGAMASHLWRSGCPIEEIMRRGRWATEKVLRRHYLRWDCVPTATAPSGQAAEGTEISNPPSEADTGLEGSDSSSGRASLQSGPA